MKYFDFFDIPISLKPDPALLKKKFLANARKFHPDFHTQSSEENQLEILELSTLNNAAYKTLSDSDLCLKYILDEKGLLEEGKDKVDSGFLMEMMEYNEALMEIKMDADSDKAGWQQKIHKLEDDLEKSYEHLFAKDFNSLSDQDFTQIKQFFLKRKYILRLLEQFDNL